MVEMRGFSPVLTVVPLAFSPMRGSERNVLKPSRAALSSSVVRLFVFLVKITVCDLFVVFGASR